jgi:thiaminase/transcriptional activator TenA
MFARLSKQIFPNVINEVCAHKFNVELFKGTLSQATFDHYLQHDIIYLGAFSKALACVAKRFSKVEYKNKFEQYSTTVKSFEVALHQDYLVKNKSSALFNPSKTIPEIEIYINHLTHYTNNEDLPAAVASLLPCYWLYSQLGSKMQLESSEKNPYHYWAVTYSDIDFHQTTKSIIEIMDELSAEVTCPLALEKIVDGFGKSIEYEKGFWDAVCRPMAHLTVKSEPEVYKSHSLTHK